MTETWVYVGIQTIQRVHHRSLGYIYKDEIQLVGFKCEVLCGLQYQLAIYYILVYLLYIIK